LFRWTKVRGHHQTGRDLIREELKRASIARDRILVTIDKFRHGSLDAMGIENISSKIKFILYCDIEQGIFCPFDFDRTLRWCCW